MKTTSFVACVVITAASTVVCRPTLDGKHEPDEVKGCFAWGQASFGDNAFSVYQQASLTNTALTLFQFLQWNPALQVSGTTKPDYNYCVNSPNTSQPSTGQAVTVTVSNTCPSIPATPTTMATTSSLPVPPTVTTNPPVTGVTSTPEQFPFSKGQLQCAPSRTTDLSHGLVATGKELEQVISTACANLLPGGSKFLAVGRPYTTVGSIFNNQKISFQLKLWLGGFPVTMDQCVTQLTTVMNGCKQGPQTGFLQNLLFGGCVYTDDGNLEGCIFPY